MRNSRLDLFPAAGLQLVLPEIGGRVFQGPGQLSIDLLSLPAVPVTLLISVEARVQSAALPMEIRAALHLRVPFQNHPGQFLQEFAQGLSGLRPPVGVVSVVYGVESAEVPAAEREPVSIVALQRVHHRPLLCG